MVAGGPKASHSAHCEQGRAQLGPLATQFRLVTTKGLTTLLPDLITGWIGQLGDNYIVYSFLSNKVIT